MPGHQRWSEANENSFESVDEFFQFPKGTAKELISMWGRGELFDGEEQSFKIPWKDLDHDDASSSSTAGEERRDIYVEVSWSLYDDVDCGLADYLAYRLTYS